MGNDRSGTNPLVEKARQEKRMIRSRGIDPLDPPNTELLPLQRKTKKLGTVSFRAGKPPTGL